MTFSASLALAATDAPKAETPAVNPLELSPEQLFGATVTSVTKTPESVWDAAAAITVLTQEDIHRSGATSIPEALRLVPGVDVARTNSGQWAVGIRGFNSTLDNKLLVLIDGREVYDHLFSGVYWEVQDLPLEDIDRIEVIRGPGATLWGANAVNGVINIITKTASQTQGVLTSALAGNQEHFTGVGQYGGRIGASGNYRVYGKYLDRDPETQALTGGDQGDGFQSWRSGFRADTVQGANKLTVQGDAYRAFESQFRNVPNTVAPPFSTTQLGSVSFDGGNLMAHWTHNLAGDSQFEWLNYVDFTHRNATLVLDDRRVALNSEAQYDFPTMGMHKIIVGARYRFSVDNLAPNAVTGLVVSAPSEVYEHLYSGFFQDQMTLQPGKWFLTVGSKLEHNDYTGFEIEPNARLQWHPDDAHTLWTSVSRAVRTPSEIERELSIFNRTTRVGPFPVKAFTEPSPEFQSEDVVAYEAGYRQRLTQDVTLDVATFLNDYSNLETIRIGAFDLSQFPPLILLPLTFTNDTSGITYGIETTVSWQARQNLKLTANHTFLKMELHGPPPTAAIAPTAPETQSPESELNLQSRWDITDRVAWDNTLYHVSSLANYKVDGYWRMDTRVGWRMNDSVEAELIGQNLFNAKHRELINTTDPSASEINRSIFARLTCQF